jgi:hypothetical protein
VQDQSSPNPALPGMPPGRNSPATPTAPPKTAISTEEGDAFDGPAEMHRLQTAPQDTMVTDSAAITITRTANWCIPQPTLWRGCRADRAGNGASTVRTPPRRTLR